jgi:hypothetical protein
MVVAIQKKRKDFKPPSTFGKHILLYKVLYQDLHQPLNVSLELITIYVAAHGNNSKHLVLSKYQG